MQTLEDVLRERVASTRANIGVIELSYGRVFILFGSVAGYPRVQLQIVGNELKVISPEDLAEAIAPPPVAEPDSAAGEFVSFPVGEPIPGVHENGALYAGEGGPEVTIQDAMIDAIAALAAAGDGGSSAPSEGEDSGGPETPASEPENGPSGNPAPVAIDPADYLKADLLEIARAEGVDSVDEDDTKAVIAAEINAKRGV